MAKRFTIPPDLFSNEEMDLINKATYRTKKRIMLKSKRKFLHEDPEAWLLANSIAYHHYKNLKIRITDCVIDFQSKYTGEDPAGRARFIIDLGRRTNEAFYSGPSTAGEACGNPVQWEILSWCDRCNIWHVSYLPMKSTKNYDENGRLMNGIGAFLRDCNGVNGIKDFLAKCPKDRIGYGYKPPKEIINIGWEGDEDVQGPAKDDTRETEKTGEDIQVYQRTERTPRIEEKVEIEWD